MTQIHHVVICWQFIEKPHAVIPGEPLHVFRVLWNVPLLLGETFNLGPDDGNEAVVLPERHSHGTMSFKSCSQLVPMVLKTTKEERPTTMIPPDVSQAALEVVPRINVDDVQWSISPATFHDFKRALSPFETGSDKSIGGSRPTANSQR